MSARPVLWLFAAVLALSGLPAADGAEKKTDEPASGRMVKTASGLKYADLAAGRGRKAAAGDTVTIHYVGRLVSGAKIDYSRARKKPATFRIVEAQVIRGWEEGVTVCGRAASAGLFCRPSSGMARAERARLSRPTPRWSMKSN